MQVAMLMLAVVVSASWYPSHQFQADSAEVAAARAEHAQAYVAAVQRNGGSIPAAYLYDMNPVQDTDEVQQAKNEFFQAYNEALLRQG